jgi:hypothetical protein
MLRSYLGSKTALILKVSHPIGGSERSFILILLKDCFFLPDSLSLYAIFDPIGVIEQPFRFLSPGAVVYDHLLEIN